MEALVGIPDPEGAGRCDACQQRIRIEIPPQAYHRHRLCSLCAIAAFPEMAMAPIVDLTAVPS